jgi:ankyrin repeat protein
MATKEDLYDILKRNRSLHDAVRDGDIYNIKSLIQAKASVNSRGPSVDTTPLHIATSSNNKDIAKLLVDLNADVNARNIDGQSPLHNSAYLGYNSIVEFLVDVGADINIRNNDGDTPLDYVVKKEYCVDTESLVQSLINAKACVTPRNICDAANSVKNDSS